MRAAAIPLLLCLLVLNAASASSTEANPIRKIVTLMQDMQKEIAQEGEKEKELYDKFMCFCESGAQDLAKAGDHAQAKIDELSSQLEQDKAEVNTLDQELAQHKTDRESARKDLSEATALREKEAAESEASTNDMKANIAALGGAIPALEKGLGGAALLQMPQGQVLQKFLKTAVMASYEKDTITSFLQGGSEEQSPGADQVVGIMKQMLESFQENLAGAEKDEATAAAGFADLKSAKTKEISVATAAIEDKQTRRGAAAVASAQGQNSLDDYTQELSDTEIQAATLKAQCTEKSTEFQERSKIRAEEVAAISEAISILNDDDALDVFKKAVPSAAFLEANSVAKRLRGVVGLTQTRTGKANAIQKAHAMLAGAASTYAFSPLSLLSYTVSLKLRLASRAQARDGNGMSDKDFAIVIQMVDRMVDVLDKEQEEDDTQKVDCEKELDASMNESKVASKKVDVSTSAISELNDEIATVKDEVATLTTEMKELDKSVAEATNQRKAEHAEYTETMALNEAAVQLLEKAKNRLNKFYNPVLYKAPPKKELTMEEKLYAKAGRSEFSAPKLVQIDSHNHRHHPRLALLQSQTFTFAPYEKKSGKSTGVLALMDMMVQEIEGDRSEAEANEKVAQKEYEKLMTESSETRAQDAKGITDKEGTVAEMETRLAASKESKALDQETLEDIGKYISHMHTQCDFLLENYDMRKEARANELDSLKNSKAVLSGATMQ